MWSVSLGAWGGVRVRLHMFFLLFAALTLYLGWIAQQQGDGVQEMPIALVCLAILLAAALVHELGHCLVATRAGLPYEEVSLGPLGSMTPLPSSAYPEVELKAYIAGPLANFLVCFACVPLLMVAKVDNLTPLLNPLQPGDAGIGPLTNADALKLVFWINWVFGLVNLLPCYPFDGGRALRAALLFWWPSLGRPGAGMLVARLAQLIAICLLVTAWFVYDADETRAVPTWFALMMLSIFLFFSAKQEEHKQEEAPPEDEMFGYDFSQGYTSLERQFEEEEDDVAAPQPGLIATWLSRRREQRQRERRERERQEEQRVDDLLALLHKHGLESLSPSDRALLERVSARYRNRSERGA